MPRVLVPVVRGPRGPRGGREGWLIDTDEALFALHKAAREAIASVPGSTVKVPDVLSKALEMYAEGRADYDARPKEAGVAGFAFEIRIGSGTFIFAEAPTLRRFPSLAESPNVHPAPSEAHGEVA